MQKELEPKEIQTEILTVLSCDLIIQSLVCYKLYRASNIYTSPMEFNEDDEEANLIKITADIKVLNYKIDNLARILDDLKSSD